MEQQIQSYYAIIPANVRYDVRIPANAKLLYGEITALCNSKGFCWADNKYFARLYSTSERTVQRWIENLAAYGYIIKNYLYNDKGVATDRCISIQTYRLSPGDKNVVTPMTKMSLPFPHTPIPQEENILNNNIIPPNPPTGAQGEKMAKIIKESDLSDSMKAVVKEWIEYKKTQHRFKYSDVGAASLMTHIKRRVSEFVESRISDIIRDSMANGYKGICWDKLDKRLKTAPEEKSYKSSDLNKMFDNLSYDDL